MKATATTIVKITLTLDSKEAEWLRRIMQNPINLSFGEPEPALDSQMRTVFWEALTNPGDQK